MKKSLPLAEDYRALAVTSLSFDMSTFELFMPLISGGYCVIASYDEMFSAEKMIQLIEKYRCNIMQVTPATWHLIGKSDWVVSQERLKSDPFVGISGGEPLKRELADALIEKGITLYNSYGPTETTVFSSIRRVVDKFENPIPIGSTLGDESMWIVDPYGNLLPPGLKGEIYIGGDGLAEGYYLNREQTDKGFVTPNQSVQDICKLDRLYRSGDVARIFDGNHGIEFICEGRVDHQVKIRGFRIELSEVEIAINGYLDLGFESVDGAATNEQVTESVVVVQKDNSEQPIMVGFYKKTNNIEPQEVLDGLKKSLPHFMLPSYLFGLDTLPLTPNNKIDRDQLPNWTTLIETGDTIVEDLTETQSVVFTIWKSSLGHEQFSIDDDFFAVGGHSLLLAPLLVEIKVHWDIDFPVVQMFMRSSIRAMSEYIDLLTSWANSGETDKQNDNGLHTIKYAEENETSVVYVHPIGGEVLAYRELALGHKKTNVYLIEQPLGQEEISIESLASDYIGLLKEQSILQSKSDSNGHKLCFIGWSMGGVLCYEMARRAVTEQLQIDAVYMLDSYARSAISKAFMAENVLKAQFKAEIVDESPRGSEEQRFDRFKKNWKALASYDPANIANDDKTGVQHVKVTLVRASNNPVSIGKLGWEEINNISLLSVEATHDTVVKNDIVVDLILKI